jgi:hypothetical protein
MIDMIEPIYKTALGYYELNIAKKDAFLINFANFE